MAAAAKAHHSTAVNPSLKFFREIVHPGTQKAEQIFFQFPRNFQPACNTFIWIIAQPFLIKPAQTVYR
jgi:uncharacterized protein YecE (DUF72 family)